MLKKVLLALVPSVGVIRMLCLMLPGIIFAWLFFPLVTVDYATFLMIYVLIMIWGDVIDIRTKLEIRD